MSIQEERELSERLGDLLGGIDPRPAPVDLVVRNGLSIRRRRHAAVAAALAVIAAGAVLGPTVIRSQLTAPPVAPPPVPHYTVTVSPPPKGAKAGVIAVGSVNGRHWQATLSGSGKNVAAAFGWDFSLMTVSEPSMAPGDFAEFDSEGGSSGAVAYVGPAAPAMRYLTMSLSNGQVVTLYPRSWSGHLYLAMVLPQALRVNEAVAYGARGELGYAIPFNYQGSANIQTWLRPGQAGLAEESAQIGAGGSGRSRWTATAYVGPWGLCMRESGGGGFCMAIGGRLRGALVTGQFGSGAGGVEVSLARQDVAYLMVTRSDGTVVRIGVTHLPGVPYGLTAVIRPGHPAFTSWVAYDVAGHRLGSGPGDPAGFL